MDSQLPSLCGPLPGSPHSRERPKQPPAGTEVCCPSSVRNPPWAGRSQALPLLPTQYALAGRAGLSLGQAEHRLHKFPKHLIFLPNIFSRPCNLHGTFQI